MKTHPRRDQAGGPYLEAHFAATLLAQRLGSDGPALIVDAACASSLVATLAGRSGAGERRGRRGPGGRCLDLQTGSLLLFSQAQSCSATGSRPFDQEADGLISSEGYAAVVLKRLDRVAAGDKVWAVLRGFGLSSDGRGKSLWAPRLEGQLAALGRAYQNGLDRGRVQYVEAHATSTQLGDATELQSLAQFFGGHGERALPLGSVKSNLGHTLETSGLAALIKVVLAMHHGTIPPTLNVKRPNEALRHPLRLVTAAEPWPELPEGGRCAGVSAFGIGGLNCHVVLESGLAAPSAPRSTLSAVTVAGRGLVLPGAGNLKELAGPRNFDFLRHKIPPKQAERANPLQFLLLEATDQALAESARPLDAENTVVLVATGFGGEFSNQLHAGLRFPELRGHLQACLQELDLDPADFLADYEEAFFRIYPALLDETGSFTSSTLASRLARTYNLMGGALAIDGAELSSDLVIHLACELLRQGYCRQAICAAAQRNADPAALETYRLRHPESGCQPVEGAGVLLLQSEPGTGTRLHASFPSICGNWKTAGCPPATA